MANQIINGGTDLAKIKLPEAGQVTYDLKNAPGLKVRATPTEKAFRTQQRCPAVKGAKWCRLGSHEEGLTIERAKELQSQLKQRLKDERKKPNPRPIDEILNSVLKGVPTPDCDEVYAYQVFEDLYSKADFPRERLTEEDRKIRAENGILQDCRRLQNFKKHVLPRLEGLVLRDIDEELAVSLIDDMVEEGIGVQTVRNTFHNMRMFFRWCAKAKYMKVNPLAEHTASTLNIHCRKPKSKKRPVSVADHVKIYEHCEAQRNLGGDRELMAIATELAFHTGLRGIEICLLGIDDVYTQEDIDADPELPMDYPSIFLSDKKTKNKNPLVIPLTDEVLELLLRANDIASDKKRLFPYTPEELRSWLYSAQRYKQRYKRTELELEGGVFTLHRARHTFVGLLKELGCSEEARRAATNHTKGGEGDDAHMFYEPGVDDLQGERMEYTAKLSKLLKKPAKLPVIKVVGAAALQDHIESSAKKRKGGLRARRNAAQEG